METKSIIAACLVLSALLMLGCTGPSGASEKNAAMVQPDAIGLGDADVSPTAGPNDTAAFSNASISPPPEFAQGAPGGGKAADSATGQASAFSSEAISPPPEFASGATGGQGQDFGIMPNDTISDGADVFSDPAMDSMLSDTFGPSTP